MATPSEERIRHGKILIIVVTFCTAIGYSHTLKAAFRFSFVAKNGPITLRQCEFLIT